MRVGIMQNSIPRSFRPDRQCRFMGCLGCYAIHAKELDHLQCVLHPAAGTNWIIR
jgi:hypothetical protein